MMQYKPSSTTQELPIHTLLQQKGGEVWTVRPDESVFEALRLMAEREVGALVVTQGEEVVGILSERDYARKVILLGKASKYTLVREIMSTEIKVVTPAYTVGECMVEMTDKRTRHLPVMLDGRLVGIVSIGDLVKSTIEHQERQIDRLNEFISGEYPC